MHTFDMMITDLTMLVVVIGILTVVVWVVSGWDLISRFFSNIRKLIIKLKVDGK